MHSSSPVLDLVRSAASVGERSRITVWAPALLLALAVGSLLAFAASSAPTRGLWFDEYATLYFADPATPPAALLADTHPPLYYLLVRAAQSLGLSEQSAMWAANGMAIVGFCLLAFALLARAGRPRFALVAIAAALASPAALTYALEGRNYSMAQFACLALTAAALAREKKPLTRADILLPVLAVLGAAAHLYGALFAGAFGAALTVVAFAQKRQPDLIRGLIIGASASVAVIIWLAIAAPVIFGERNLVEWIPNTLSYTVGQFWFFNKTLSGFGPNVVFLVTGLLLCLWLRTSRPAAALLALTAAVFFTLPVIASVFVPMLHGRYLAIAAPALVMLALHTAFRAADPAAATQPRVRAGAVVAFSLFALIAAVFAPNAAARFNAENRYPWQGEEVRALLGNCDAPRLRVWSPDLPKVGDVDQQALYLASYRRALGRNDVVLEPSTGAVRDIADYPCDLIAWGEHTTTFGLEKADEAALLAELRLKNATAAPLSIVLHDVGFVLMRAHPEQN
ncbi:MAG TPA: hypothetical protein VIA80_00250 [Hyphomonadaceae bacterium]